MAQPARGPSRSFAGQAWVAPRRLGSGRGGAAETRLGEVPVAFVVLRQESAATTDELLDHCRGSLVKRKLPADSHPVDAMPRNHLGKADKPALRAAVGTPGRPPCRAGRSRPAAQRRPGSRCSRPPPDAGQSRSGTRARRRPAGAPWPRRNASHARSCRPRPTRPGRRPPGRDRWRDGRARRRPHRPARRPRYGPAAGRALRHQCRALEAELGANLLTGVGGIPGDLRERSSSTEHRHQTEGQQCADAVAAPAHPAWIGNRCEHFGERGQIAWFDRRAGGGGVLAVAREDVDQRG